MKLKTLALLALLPAAVLAKLPVPELSPENQAKAAETKARAAHQTQVDGYQTCLASGKAAAHYFKTHPEATKPAAAPACADPGPFVAATPVPAAPAANAGATTATVPAPKNSDRKP